MFPVAGTSSPPLALLCSQCVPPLSSLSLSFSLSLSLFLSLSLSFSLFSPESCVTNPVNILSYHNCITNTKNFLAQGFSNTTLRSFFVAAMLSTCRGISYNAANTLIILILPWEKLQTLFCYHEDASLPTLLISLLCHNTTLHDTTPSLQCCQHIKRIMSPQQLPTSLT